MFQDSHGVEVKLPQSKQIKTTEAGPSFPVTNSNQPLREYQVDGNAVRWMVRLNYLGVPAISMISTQSSHSCSFEKGKFPVQTWWCDWTPGTGRWSQYTAWADNELSSRLVA